MKHQQGVSSHATSVQGGCGSGAHFSDCFYDVTKLLLQVRTARGDVEWRSGGVSVCVELHEHGSTHVCV